MTDSKLIALVAVAAVSLLILVYVLWLARVRYKALRLGARVVGASSKRNDQIIYVVEIPNIGLFSMEDGFWSDDREVFDEGGKTVADVVLETAVKLAVKAYVDAEIAEYARQERQRKVAKNVGAIDYVKAAGEKRA